MITIHMDGILFWMLVAVAVFLWALSLVGARNKRDVFSTDDPLDATIATVLFASGLFGVVLVIIGFLNGVGLVPS